MSIRSSRRWSLVAAGASIVCTGLAVHFAVGGEVGGFVADALYAAFVYVLLALLVLRMRTAVPAVLAVLALAFCAGIELWQLTGVPGDLSRSIPGASLVLGSTFQWVDLAAYAGGVAVAAALDAGSQRAVKRRAAAR